MGEHKSHVVCGPDGEIDDILYFGEPNSRIRLTCMTPEALDAFTAERDALQARCERLRVSIMAYEQVVRELIIHDPEANAASDVIDGCEAMLQPGDLGTAENQS
jgi:hypothetical protein